MKPISLIATCIVAAMLAESTYGILPVAPGIAAPIIPPVFPPMLGALPFFGGFGFPFFGPFGFGPFGFGGLGLGLGLGRFGLLRGKRDITPQEIKCTIDPKALSCSLGVSSGRIACTIESHDMPSIRLRLIDLSVADNKSFMSLISPKSSNDSKFTFIDPSTRKPNTLSFYWDVSVKQPGFLVKDKVCYESIVSTIKSADSVKFDLNIF
jgi:hypothetical protein